MDAWVEDGLTNRINKQRVPEEHTNRGHRDHSVPASSHKTLSRPQRQGREETRDAADNCMDRSMPPPSSSSRDRCAFHCRQSSRPRTLRSSVKTTCDIYVRGCATMATVLQAGGGAQDGEGDGCWMLTGAAGRAVGLLNSRLLVVLLIRVVGHSGPGFLSGRLWRQHTARTTGAQTGRVANPKQADAEVCRKRRSAGAP